MNTETFQKVFNTNYVVVNITVSKEETSEFVNCSNPVKTFGKSNCKPIQFPFWYVLNDEGNIIGTSFIDGNQNIGYPTKNNMESFLAIIKTTSDFTKINLELLSNFIQNKKDQQLYTSK
ncbi:hypothetical protein [Tenacibaculum sp. SZ-18]|uniref:hypothetical protein n=1 Tax=Tenacibaculum sp. SZ-18 TaxID=754423 RepID=UPI003001E5AA